MATILTPHFTLEEMTFSQSAIRKNIDEQFKPSIEIINNLTQLCTHVLEPIRSHLGYPIRISSGYRCVRLNKLIGGAKKSQHLDGMAADIIDEKNGNQYLFNEIKKLGLPFDQMIDEFGLSWIHISYDIKRSRKQILLAKKDQNGKTIYVAG